MSKEPKFSLEDHGPYGTDLDGMSADITILGPPPVGDFPYRDTLAYVPYRDDLPALYEALKFLKRTGAF